MKQVTMDEFGVFTRYTQYKLGWITLKNFEYLNYLDSNGSLVAFVKHDNRGVGSSYRRSNTYFIKETHVTLER